MAGQGLAISYNSAEGAGVKKAMEKRCTGEWSGCGWAGTKNICNIYKRKGWREGKEKS
jgi:hypothetical protein